MEKSFVTIGGYPTSGNQPAVLVRKEFELPASFRTAVLRVCAVGYGVFYLNGKPIARDVLSAPVSDYDKTLWYSEYDVKRFLLSGTNAIAADLGNGFFNENFRTNWDWDRAPWRASPAVTAELEVDGKIVLRTDPSWRVRLDEATYHNQLRSGEYYDARKASDEWKAAGYRDGEWACAVPASSPRGELRPFLAEPVRECRRFSAKRAFRNSRGFVIDFGRNFSGYAEIVFREEAGREIVLRYAEETDEAGELRYNGVNNYREAPFQTDRVICSGRPFRWKPKFVYHGFRFLEIEGLSGEPTLSDMTGIFVHSDVARTSVFRCSDPMLNKIFRAGIAATESNMMHILTDCPTREKMGWTNDAQATAEQLLYNFDSEKFLVKWLRDIWDSQCENGMMPGVAPSPGWGYGNGPVCDGILFSLPYFLWKLRGNARAMVEGIPYMEKYFRWMETEMKDFPLADWRGGDASPVPKAFIKKAYELIFLYILSAAYGLAGDGEKEADCKRRFRDAEKAFAAEYVEDGKSKLSDLASVAAITVFRLGDREKLRRQMAEILEECDHHLVCGMFGVQFLWRALSELDMTDDIPKIVENPVAPSYRTWIEAGATTLWEAFYDQPTISKNHQMFSNILAWMIGGALGIRIGDAARAVFVLRPEFPSTLRYARGEVRLGGNGVRLFWRRVRGEIELTIDTLGKAVAEFRGERLRGHNVFRVPQRKK